MHWVWRISSVLLLTLWALLAAAPFAQAEPDRAASLPACCRIHGAHHCAGEAMRSNEAMQASEAPAFAPASLHEKCPCTPASGASVLLDAAAALTEARAFQAPAATAQAMRRLSCEAREQVSTAANPKRGPPTFSTLR
ncbi:hypothetical protein [Granulicella rosea]|nr:hypothetical protein [Granulicella rosea]